MSLLSHRIERESVYHHLETLFSPQSDANRLASLSALPLDIKERMCIHHLEMTQQSLSDRAVGLDLLGFADLKEIVKKLAWEIFEILPPMEKGQVALQEQHGQKDTVRLLQRMSQYLGDWTPGMQTKIDRWAQNRPNLTQPLVDFLKKGNPTISLQELKLDRLSCVFSDIPFSRHLRKLELGENQFAEFPEEIFSLFALEELNLRCNELHSVPEQIDLLSNLTMLVLSYNKISSLPNTIGMLPQLRLLYLSNNQLPELPPSICQLQHLEALWVDGNQLTQLPDDIGLLPQLTDLELSYNRNLGNIPDSILHRGLDHLGLVGTAFAEQSLESLQALPYRYPGISFLPIDEGEWEAQTEDAPEGIGGA